MKCLLTLNIRHGGGKRIGRLVEVIKAISSETFVLTEFRNGDTGKTLRAALAAEGWPNQYSSPSPPKANGLLIGSKRELSLPSLDVSPDEWPRNRHIAVQVGAGTIVAVYVLPGPDKLDAWQRLLKTATALAHGRTILMGDFNTGKHFVDEEGATFISPECLDRLEALSYVDAWRSRHPNGREYTWYSPGGNGFRLDYAFVSAIAAESIVEARHIHETRLTGATDHSGLVVGMDLP